MTRTKRICSDATCSRAAASRGLCDKHYKLARRRGELPTEWEVHKNLKVRCVCQFVDCGKEFYAWPYRVANGEAKYCSNECAYAGTRSGEWRACESPSCNNTIYLYPHQVKSGAKRFCSHPCYLSGGTSGTLSPSWAGADITVSGAHGRVRKLWGSASQYLCIQCGKRAREWAYDGTDPEQRYGAAGSGSYVYYSPWPEFYMPMCYGCHKARDKARMSIELQEYRWFKQIFGNLAAEMLAAYCDTRDSAKSVQ